MTDKERALALGTRLLTAKLLVEQMKLELQAAREFSPLARRTQQIVEEAQRQVLQPANAERIETLRRRLEAATPDDLLEVLQASLDELLA